jgi:hypothetical protein
MGRIRKLTPAFKEKVTIEAIKENSHIFISILQPTLKNYEKALAMLVKFYNYQRLHQSLEKLLPGTKYGIVV